MVLAVSVRQDREMEGHGDKWEGEIFMRSSCWGEAGRQASRALAAACQQPADNSTEV